MIRSTEGTSSSRIAILGAGNLGSALAHVLATRGNAVTVWDHFQETRDEIRQHRTNRRFLKGISLSPDIHVAETPADCVEGADIVIPCVPSRFLAETVKGTRDHLKPDAVFLNVAKGFAPGTTKTIPAWMEELFPGHPCAHLAGPCLAGEFALGYPGGIVIAARKTAVAEKVSAVFPPELFPVIEITTDLEGAALAGILKNSYAIFLGMLDHLVSGGENLKATALTCCSREMAAFLSVMGADATTIHGLAGLGDLIATGLSPESHNRRFGVRIAGSETISGMLADGEWLPEGANATPMLLDLVEERGLHPPLLAMLTRVLDGSKPDIREILAALSDTSTLGRV